MSKPKYNGTYANRKGTVIRVDCREYRTYYVFVRDKDGVEHEWCHIPSSIMKLFLVENGMYCLDTMRSYDD